MRRTASLCMLALHLAKERGTMNSEEVSDAAQAMEDIPNLIETMLTPEKLAQVTVKQGTLGAELGLAIHRVVR